MTIPVEGRAVTKRKRLKTPDAAEYVGVSAGTLVWWRCTRSVNIPYVRIGRAVVYDTDDLDAFLSAHRVDHSTPAGEGGAQ